jgi:hypothetical protein
MALVSQLRASKTITGSIELMERASVKGSMNYQRSSETSYMMHDRWA